MRPAAFYHFTSRVNWHFIRTEGIVRGEAPISLRKVLVHPNLTSDPDPYAQKWAGYGQMPIRKTAVRITVKIDPDDASLISFLDFTRLHEMPRADYRALDQAGGWKAKNWWIYRGVVLPEKFTDVEFFDGDNPSDYERRMIKEAEASSSYDDMLDRIGAKRVGTVVFLPREIPA